MSMSASPDDSSIRPQQMRKIILAALSASTLEWYDFYIYGTAAALVFNKVFFPDVSPALGTLAGHANAMLRAFLVLNVAEQTGPGSWSGRRTTASVQTARG